MAVIHIFTYPLVLFVFFLIDFNRGSYNLLSILDEYYKEGWELLFQFSESTNLEYKDGVAYPILVVFSIIVKIMLVIVTNFTDWLSVCYTMILYDSVSYFGEIVRSPASNSAEV